MRLLKKILLSALALALLASCEKDDGPVKEKIAKSRTIFVYMAMDDGALGGNTLNGVIAVNNLNDMILGATAANIGRNKIIVYQDRLNVNPKLIKIYAGADGKGTSEVLRDYDVNYDSADPAVLEMVLGHMMEAAPDSDSYGLILGSHGTSWKPTVMSYVAGDLSSSVAGDLSSSAAGDLSSSVAGDLSSSAAAAKSANHTPHHTPRHAGGYGYIAASAPPSPAAASASTDGITVMDIISDVTASSYMELSDFAATIPDGVFDFIVFDVCYMSSIEIAYALRNKADYIVASAAEVPGDGLPYASVIRPLFLEKPKLGAGGVAELYYRSYLNGGSATTAVIDCRELDSEFVSLVRNYVGDQDRFAALRALSPGGVQYYDRLMPHIMYDMGEIIKAVGPASDYLPLVAKLEKVIAYKAMTPYVFGLSLTYDKFSGITMHIPFNMSLYSSLNHYYTETDWFKDIYESQGLSIE